MRKIFFLDCQLFQTPTLHRGMGRYALGILKAVFEYENEFFNDYELVCIYNKNISVENEEWMTIVKELSGDTAVSFEGLDLLSVVDDNRSDYAIKSNKQRLGEFIDTTYPKSNKTYYIPALLDDTIYAGFPDCKESVTNAVLFHDLIPYLFPERYLQTDEKKSQYFHRLRDIFMADIILCNSRTTANDLSRFLFIDKNKLFVLKSGNTNELPGQKQANDEISEKIKAFKDKKFILSVSGDDSRKNNERMVAAFDQFNKLHNEEYLLIMTSGFSEDSKKRLSYYTDKIQFTGVISNKDLEWLYSNCTCVLFIPEYEGLGLPILEALTHKAKMLVSDIEVFREITKKAIRFTDYMDVPSIASALNEVVHDWEPKPDDIHDVLNEWNWKVTAEIWKKSFAVSKDTVPKKVEGKRVAILMPDPTGISAIGRFVQSHHATISRKTQVTYYFESSPSVKEERVAYLPFVAECKSVTVFEKDHEQNPYDVIIYHLGNSDYHLATLQLSLRYPGTVVLHDTDLFGLAIVSEKFGLWDKPRFKAEELLNKKLQEKAMPALNFSGSAVMSAKKVITHSTYAAHAVTNAVHESVRIVTEQLPMSGPVEYDKPTHEDGVLRVGMAGIINMSKGTDVLRMSLQDDKSSQGILYHLFGFSFAADYVGLLKLFELGPVLLELDLTDIAFQNRLAHMDVLLNYRPRYHGEASSATLEAMRYGVVPIVRDIGWFSQLPDDAVIKVSNPEEVPSVLESLKNDRKKLARMSKAAYEYVRLNCPVEKYVEECLSYE